MNENMIFKEHDGIMSVDIHNDEIEVTKSVVRSFDYDTCKFTYKLTKDGVPLSLSGASKVNVTLKFGNEATAILDATTVDTIESIISFVYPEQYLGYSGRVLGEVSIQYENGQTLVAGYFSFVSKGSYIDEAGKEIPQFYWERFEDAEGLAKETIELIEKNKVVKDSDFQEAIGKTADKKEVEEVKKEVEALKKEVDTKATKQETDNKLEKKTNNDTFVAITSDMQRQIESTQSGMLGEFDSGAQLKTTYPNGAKGYAIVWLNENDQKLGYTYTYKNGSWVKGNVWNGMGIPKNSVGNEELKINSVDNSKVIHKELTSDKMNFFKASGVNLFDKRSIDFFMFDNYGNVIPSQDILMSCSIEVKPKTKYISNKNINSYAEYDSAGNQIYFNHSYAKPEIITKDTTASIIITYYHIHTDSLMFCENTLPQKYESYSEALDIKLIPEEVLDQDFNVEKIDDKSIEPLKLSDFKSGTNKANPQNLKTQFYVVPSTGQIFTDNPVYNTYHLLENENSGISDVNYIVTNARFITFYDEEMNVISDLGLNLTTNPVHYKFIMNKKVKYYSVTFDKKYTDFMISENVKMPEYRPFKYILKNLEIEDSNIIKTENEEKNTNVDYLKVGQALYSTTGEDETFLFENIFFDKTHPYSYNLNPKLVLENKGLSIDKSATGIYPETTRVYDNSNVEIIKRVFNCVIRNKTTKKIKVLLIGDSTVRSNGTGEITKYLKQYFGDLIELIGTMGSEGNFFEGRGGWTANAYVNQEKDATYTNAFYNPATKKFDFAYYLQQNNLPKPDLVIFQLGINDVFNLKTDDEVILESEKFFGNLNYMIDNITSYDSSIKVALNIPIGPNKNQARFDEVYKRSQTQQRYERNNNILVKQMIEYYNGKIDLIPVHLTIDRNIEISDGVHPKTEGYVKMAKIVRNYINSL